MLGPQETRAVPQTGTGGPYQAFAALAETPAVFARGLATAVTGSGEVQDAIATLQDVSQQVADAPIPFAANMAPLLEIQALEIQALEIEAAASASRGQIDEAIATMRRATTREEAMPVPPGPATLDQAVPRAARRDPPAGRSARGGGAGFCDIAVQASRAAQSLEGAAQAAQG